jgi:hypothetical protein
MSKQKIIIAYEAPPVPSTKFDWRAGYAGQEEDGKDGFGASPQQALQELIDNYND